MKKGASPTVINMCNGFDTIGVSDRVMMQGCLLRCEEEPLPFFRRQITAGRVKLPVALTVLTHTAYCPVFLPGCSPQKDIDTFPFFHQREDVGRLGAG